jgi:Holliday junction resolvase
MTPEGKVKKEIRAVLDAAGCWHFSPQMNGYGRAGIPDIIACLNGQLLAIEVKSDVGKLTPHQEREIEAIQRAGGVAFVARSGEDVKEVLRGNALQRKT